MRAFLHDCENPPPGKKRHSILCLVADGAELAARLETAAASPGTDPLSAAIRPYLQLVPGEGEPEIRDEFTGLRLGDIWRYFRYTWAIPQTAIPGRQLFYLIRDAAHACHAIIGIAALGNSPLIAPDRDRAIGWTIEAFSERFLRAAKEKDTGFLAWAHAYLLDLLDKALAEVDHTGLADPADFSAPPAALIARLQRQAREFAAERQQALKECAEADRAGTPLVLQETETVYRVTNNSTNGATLGHSALRPPLIQVSHVCGLTRLNFARPPRTLRRPSAGASRTIRQPQPVPRNLWAFFMPYPARR